MKAARRLRVPDRVAEFLGGSHPHIKRRLRAALDLLTRDAGAGKALQGELEGLTSLRVGRFRVIYRPARGRIIEIATVGPRESVYEETLRLVKTERPRKARGRPPTIFER